MAVTVTAREQITIVETLAGNPSSAADAKRVVTHDAFDETHSLTGATTPPVTLPASFILTLTAGAATINLRSLVGTNGAVIDGNGLKVQLFRFKNLGENVMTITPGAANGHDLLGTGSSLTVPPGGVFQMFFNDNGPDIATADAQIDVAGTGAQTAEVTIVMG